MKLIQLRDRDAIQLLRQRDYDMIELSFEKFTQKLALPGLKETLIKSHNYRKYNQAYYEEIVIDYNLEARITLNFRERFLVTKEDQMIVMEMYAKNDYVGHFIKILDATMITHE